MKRILGCVALMLAVGCGGTVDSDGIRQAESNTPQCGEGKTYVSNQIRIKTSRVNPWKDRKGVIIIYPSSTKSPDGRPRFNLWGIDPQKPEFVWFFIDAVYEDYKILMSYKESGDPCDKNGSNPGGGGGSTPDPDPARGGYCAPDSLLGDAQQCQGCVPKTCQPDWCDKYPDGCGGTIDCSANCWK